MMQHDGRFGDRRLLSEETVRLATNSVSKYSKYYALHWVVFADNVFGHGGFQGTFAWVDKAHDLIGLYLTQSQRLGNDTLVPQGDPIRPYTPQDFKKLVESAIVK
jgi:CubicO group peptidase (beta-lactamase class C family)